MFFNHKDIERCRSALAGLIQQFNNRLEKGDEHKSHAIPYDWSDPYDMSLDDIRKCVYETEYRVTDEALLTDWYGADISEAHDHAYYAHWKIKELRKAWKGLRIAATKKGYPIPDDFTDKIDRQYEKWLDACKTFEAQKYAEGEAS